MAMLCKCYASQRSAALRAAATSKFKTPQFISHAPARDAAASRRLAVRGLRRSWFRFNIRMVSQQPEPRRPGPPHNPGVCDLAEGKRRWSSPPKMEDAKRGFRGWHERGYLPHRDEPGLTQFVTFHLAGSFPESLRSEWEHFAKIEDDRERRKELEAYLDKGRGECHLQQPEIARLVEDNFRQFAGHCGGSVICDPNTAGRYECGLG